MGIWSVKIRIHQRINYMLHFIENELSRLSLAKETAKALPSVKRPAQWNSAFSMGPFLSSIIKDAEVLGVFIFEYLYFTGTTEPPHSSNIKS